MIRKLLLGTAAAVLMSGQAMAAGLPGMRGVDHIGITVPDLKQAVDFFVNVLGCEAFFQLGPFKADNDWMQVHLGVDPRAEIPVLQNVRCGYGANLEVFQYTAADQKTAYPKNSDVGGHHIALYVDDMAAAVAHLKANGVRMLGEPTLMEQGPSAGETWLYFLTPWGLQMELVSYPQGMAYEKDGPARMWSPKDPSK
ncbi:MAG: VOC family protein [Geminicoccaceae bacterium]